jgi:hypothetical protein
MSDRPDLRTVARLLIVAKRMGVRPAWLDELLAAVTLPAGPARPTRAIAINASDAAL